MEFGVHASGTFNANPISVAAALATIAELEKEGVYEKFEYLGNMLTEGLKKIGRKYGIKLYTAANGAICQLQIGIDRPVESYRDCLLNVDYKKYDQIFLKATKYGVRLIANRGRIYLSTAHTEEDIRRTLDVMDQIFSEL